MKFVLVRLRCRINSPSGGRKALFIIEAGKDSPRITHGGERVKGLHHRTIRASRRLFDTMKA